MHATLKNYRSQGSDSTGRVLARQVQETELGLLHSCKKLGMVCTLQNPRSRERETGGFLGFTCQPTELASYKPERVLASKHKVDCPWGMTGEVVLCTLHPHTHACPHTRHRRERGNKKNPWSLLFSYNLRVSKNEDIYGCPSGWLSPSHLHVIPQT